MYEYSIYRIREEIANHYYHKSDILYRFLKEYEKNKELLYLHGQFLYITNKFTQKKIELYLNKYLAKTISYITEQSKIKIFNEKQSITLHLNKYCINFRCESLHDAEEFLFPVLRKYDSLLFVIGNQHVNYGWISPISKLNTDHGNLVLYSSR
ncbi:sporulation inhibitor of replication protein SirA [Oceanobacillus chungangensis]|uniref:Sporulation inhibitor of replication protein SirA n=1 Tax=Oceanobacillus chungangensis TaxID=1229152 RepID=A0A3D8PPW9_9BACI|nr:sporulation inhibitor of replication protein SirA [Oceanobacillus chungangensis]RDW17752.1 hypothetical protein CWR45_10475 [Oceanobacillus chungangensis]